MKRTRFVLISVLLLLAASFLLLNGCNYITGATLNGSIQTRLPVELIKNISPTEAYAVIALNAGHVNFTLIDVRTPAEYAAGHIPGAINRDLNSPTFKDDIAIFDKSKIYLLYCHSGARSASARDVMQELGFQQIYSMIGGITDWMVQGLPVVK